MNKLPIIQFRNLDQVQGYWGKAAEGAGFEESEHGDEHLEKHMGWKNLGKILCGHVTQPSDINRKFDR